MGDISPLGSSLFIVSSKRWWWWWEWPMSSLRGWRAAPRCCSSGVMGRWRTGPRRGQAVRQWIRLIGEDIRYEYAENELSLPPEPAVEFKADLRAFGSSSPVVEDVAIAAYINYNAALGHATSLSIIVCLPVSSPDPTPCYDNGWRSSTSRSSRLSCR